MMDEQSSPQIAVILRYFERETLETVSTPGYLHWFVHLWWDQFVSMDIHRISGGVLSHCV